MIGDDRAGHAARAVEHLHPAVVRRHQRALGGGQRDQELAARVLAVDLQRAGEADRNLGHADEVLDVAAGDLRIERELVHVLQALARELLDEALPPFDHRRHEVVVL